MTTCFLMIAGCFLPQFSYSAVLKTSSRASESYDQKQTGDYNIRLHLKDFQIIALLSEEALNALSDDYEDLDYHIPDEYLDVPLPTTQKQDSISSTTIEISTHPSIVERIKTTTGTTLSTTTATSPPRRTVTSRVTTKKPEIITRTTPSTTLSTLSTTITTIKQDISNKSFTDNPFREDADKIPVISTSVTILPSGDDSGHAGSVSQVMLGEILQYKRCPDGYSRDKMGRCRKTRRPQLPFDITRFTSSLATRFKRPVLHTSTAKSDS
ncbi:hypothetical protein QE152_g12959 [Popillia japonica]|uniref:Uncharacterized protein n=1 Tax=Popillia japonica TaxID=7064 RepID=A0AAW1LB68_POPJA